MLKEYPEYSGLAGIPYIPIKITGGYAHGEEISVGTGFQFAFDLGDKVVPLIITNKHVIEDFTWLTFDMPLADENGRRVLGKHAKLPTLNFSVAEHPDPNVDLVGIFAGPLQVSMAEQNVRPFSFNLHEGNIPNQTIKDSFSPIESVIMVGFPTGLMDTVNNLPVTRKGITATPLFADYMGKKEFMIDMAVFGGSSGSPIFLVREGVIFDGPGKYRISAPELHLVGVVHSGFDLKSTGAIESVPVPTADSDNSEHTQHLNLGLCLKAELILDLKPVVESIIAGLRPTGQ